MNYYKISNNFQSLPQTKRGQNEMKNKQHSIVTQFDFYDKYCNKTKQNKRTNNNHNETNRITNLIYYQYI